ncbi:PTS sugar transporter subunit IIA [Clostridium chauvoei]|uniref:PTS mannose transporter subunit IID n=2 Tax=Clostridium chauvoei TaxID=46867 RepID=A0ABD4RFV9_9CLOT|nr:PTS mannose transporter subunit IID [Clostridium chauvoei]ATD55787.1 PTS mannose transporter subunit IID [Clostridium chauvoei]ATD56538.1 PTS mannose transporter subunit IID [Clostridium chauvoei]MBX7280333.1 PTS mannose transporter subunit IID [Clostridium chauvoei]MBX7282818.1 PTS mannose transporter subunit IID [Clostridium chauvoei]MBX7285224.1 PTS mannose transporter subunit IID [Clostridium chauvoei]
MKILIVGHGEYATGIKSAIKLLTGVDENIDAINLNNELTHEDFTIMIKEYVKENKELIIFADITGGAPFQITSREVLLNEESQDQYVVGGVSVACILDIVMNTVVIASEDDTRQIINNAVDGVREMASVMCRKDLME